ncbi:hypothetical protein FB45DRAFT_400776 [Roridomyces roridus]|uniref:Uncharacterized protein n=1 Tax=Roridomyces roridus TaxID=1738132 RepID=A0AAD7C3T9_9AGAR|nr:hypothetical protein FB45DRAFT_400776 [Roridomyces roridus]
MRCIPTTTFKNAFRTSGFSCRPSLHARQSIRRVCATSAVLSHPLGASVAVSDSSASLPNLLVKPSKISFAAAQAIRMCMNNGGTADAFFVLNSIRYAAHRHSSSVLPFKMPGILHSKTEFEEAALQFGPGVSQRLSAHVLLHGLLRHHQPEPAFELAKLMMAEGVSIRAATLEAVIKSLVSPPPALWKGQHRPPHPDIPLTSAADAMCLRPSIMADQRTRFALKLLFLARRHRQRRTDTMFKLFMAVSLLNGELIIFSLLFGWTCRDWQTAYSLEQTLEAIPEDHQLHLSSQATAAKLRLTHLRSEAIVPDRDTLHRGLSVIASILARDGDVPEPTHARLVALQALGNIAGLLDRRQIPFPDIAPLIRTMYNCPRVEDEIWIKGPRGCPERIKAHSYFHRVLGSLIRKLPSHPPAPTGGPRALVENHRFHMLPPLDLCGYNSLLHYSLRHRLSPTMAHKVLSHGLEVRHKPIHPDTVTANILIRSGTLLRRYDIVTQVLQSMGQPTFVPQVPFTPPTPDAHVESKVILPTETIPVVPRKQRGQGRLEWGFRIRRASGEEIQIPGLPADADIRTLTSYISYLTTVGRPLAIRNLLFQVIPELRSAIYPTNSELKEDRPLGRASFLAALRRSITLGPVFFTVVLDALYKSGQPALADRVWELAKRAERASWMRYHLPEGEPWIFGPQTYTIMLNCYGDLARRRRPYLLKMRRNQRISRRTSVDSVWASFVYECQKMPPPLQPHRVLQLLHDMMGGAALAVFRRLHDLPRTYARIHQLRDWLPEEDLPKPDARFFNAALRVFRPRVAAPAHKAWYRKRLNAATFQSQHHGMIPESKGWNLPLHEVAEHMLAAGFALPIGVQYLFAGRLEGIERPDVERPDRAPYEYPKYRLHWRRFRIGTPKERGLPLSWKARKWRRVQRKV